MELNLIIRSIIEILFVALVVYFWIREDRLVRFEDKIKKKINNIKLNRERQATNKAITKGISGNILIK